MLYYTSISIYLSIYLSLSLYAPPGKGVRRGEVLHGARGPHRQCLSFRRSRHMLPFQPNSAKWLDVSLPSLHTQADTAPNLFQTGGLSAKVSAFAERCGLRSVFYIYTVYLYVIYTVYLYVYIYIYIYMYCVYIYIYIYGSPAVGFHNLNLRIFSLRVSNPNKLVVFWHDVGFQGARVSAQKTRWDFGNRPYHMFIVCIVFLFKSLFYHFYYLCLPVVCV